MTGEISRGKKTNKQTNQNKTKQFTLQLHLLDHSSRVLPLLANPNYFDLGVFALALSSASNALCMLFLFF